MSHDLVINTLEKELSYLKKNNERLSIQVETCNDMLHNYKLKMKDNNEKIHSIKYILSML